MCFITEKVFTLKKNCQLKRNKINNAFISEAHSLRKTKDKTLIDALNIQQINLYESAMYLNIITELAGQRETLSN